MMVNPVQEMGPADQMGKLFTQKSTRVIPAKAGIQICIVEAFCPTNPIDFG
jgi:hypothetical protein